MKDNAQKRPMIETHISADQPIMSKVDDRLNRSGFSKALANLIGCWRKKPSLVIGLFGDWGTGKSSIKNMVVEALNEEKGNGPAIVEFSPWQFSDPNSLLEAFFREIGAAIGKPSGTNEEATKKRVARWKKYSGVLSVAAIVARALKSATDSPQPTPLSLFSGALSTAVGTTAEVVKVGVEAVESDATLGTLSLFELKSSIADDLSDLESPILVILDDIDRLAKDEIRLVLQLVKANADFPNIIYLLLAHRAVLTAALAEVAPEKGEAFLEKIVQVSFDVPQLNRKQLRAVLLKGLDDILAGKNLNERFEKDRWASILPEIMLFFQNLREVNRFLSSLAFHVELFRNGETFEVNPIDLIGLEVLRTFEPGVFQRLHKENDILTYEPRWSREREREGDKERVENLIGLASAERGVGTRKLIRQLFPPSDLPKLDGQSLAVAENRWFQKLRVCSYQAFDKYFQLATPEGDISRAEIDELIAHMHDQADLRRIFERLKQKDLLETALTRLHALKETLPLAHAPIFLAALFEIEMKHRDYGLFEMSPRSLLIGLTYWYLQRQTDEERAETLISALALTSHVGTGFATAAQLALDPRPDSSVTPFLESEGLRRRVRSACVGAIHRVTKEANSLLPTDDLRFVHYWRTFDSAGVAKWIDSYLQSRAAVVGFLQALVNTSDGTGGVKHYVLYGQLEGLIDAEELERRVKEHLDKDLSDDEAELVNLLGAALRRKREGKSEDPGAMIRGDWE